MNSRFLTVAGVVLLLVAGLMLVVRQLEVMPPESRASLKVVAANAGLVLTPEQGRVVIYRAGSTATPVVETTLGAETALPAGQYDVRVLFSASRDLQTRWLRNLAVMEGERQVQNVSFSSGEISVAASVGNGDDEKGQIVASVFPASETNQVITTMGSDEPVLLRSGQYDVRVVWTVAAQEKDVRWFRGVDVRPGLQTKVNAQFERGTLLVDANNDGTAIPAGGVSIDVFRGGDQQLELIDSGIAGVRLGLATGTYDLKATYTRSHDKPTRWLRGVVVQDGEVSEERVEFSSGAIVVNAHIGSEQLKRFDVYVYYYNAGDHRQPVAYTTGSTQAVLESGVYDVRVAFFRSDDQPDVWLRNIQLDAGSTLPLEVSFASSRLIVRAYDDEGREVVGDNVFVYVYPQGARKIPITKARSGELMTLTAGVYDLLAQDSRSEQSGVWLPDVKLKSGQLIERKVSVSSLDAGPTSISNLNP